MATRYIIRFKNQDFSSLSAWLLADLAKEHWAVLLGKTERINHLGVLKIHEIIYPDSADYMDQQGAFLRLKKTFVHRALTELVGRADLDTMIDVHTHPFCEARVAFSGVDDRDEIQFLDFLSSHFDSLTYASIVLSQTEYSARVWGSAESRTTFTEALIRPQCISERIPSSGEVECPGWSAQPNLDALTTEGMFARGVLALGLDVMRRIVADQTIAIVGIGGLGSIIAEHLVHMGFHNIVLIDPDFVEVSNLNRIVGAYFEDAQSGRSKVDVVARHLSKINPAVRVAALRYDVHAEEVEEFVASADWLFIATDNHSSRHKAQHLSIKYFVPLISVGVNIAVEDGCIRDMSGEVITARIGDNLCLNCLGRINFIKIASEVHTEEFVRTELVRRGYVVGQDIHEPAVKTLNSILASLAVDTLVNQYTATQRHIPILVYENNAAKAIYEDSVSLAQRNIDCFTCGMAE